MFLLTGWVPSKQLACFQASLALRDPTNPLLQIANDVHCKTRIRQHLSPTCISAREYHANYGHER
jgi:hypothetical protein